MDTNNSVRAIRHEVVRLSFAVDQPYEAFRARFEHVVAAVGLRIFWRSERAHGWASTSYLVGNPVVADGLYREDPAVMAVVPFPMLISVGPDAATRLTFDQPSTRLTSFAGDAFAAAATKVDAKFAELLDRLGVEGHTTVLRAGPHV
jgi:hypothetical protein